MVNLTQRVVPDDVEPAPGAPSTEGHPESGGSTATAATPPNSLRPNSISFVGVLFVAVATMAPGTGAAYAIAGGAGFAGGSLTLAVLVALLGSLLVATAVGQLAKHMSTAGGLASYVGVAMHPSVGFVVAWAYPFVYLAAMPYLALVFGNLLAGAIVPSGTGAAYTALWIAGALACLAVAMAANFFGADLGARLGILLGAFEIVVLVVLSVWMIVAAGEDNTASVLTTSHAEVPGFLGTSGIIAASVFGFLAFIGFEAAAPLAEETKDPRRNVPRAVVLSALLVGVFYLLTTYASTVVFGVDEMSGFLSYNGGNAWIGLASRAWGIGWVILLIALLNSTLACMNGASMASTRAIWAMGRSGTLPSWFARTHPRWKSPVSAIVTLFGVGTVLTFAAGLTWDPVTAYALCGTVLTVAVLPIYFLVALACPIYYLRYRRSELNVVLHVVIPLLGAAFLVPAFFAGAGLPVFSFVSSLTWPINLAGPIVCAWYAIGAALAVYLSIRSRGSLDSLALSGHDDAVPAEPHGAPGPAPRPPAETEVPLLR